MWHDEHEVQEYSSGNCLFKVLCRKSGLDTKSATSFIRKSLTTLDANIKEVGGDILKFNAHVRGLVRYLTERGE